MSQFGIRVPDPFGSQTYIAYDDVACAGAIFSLNWNGIHFVNYGDDGRLLQTALTTDDNEEAYNPTEGGGTAHQMFATRSDSICLDHDCDANWLRTQTRMAFWKPVNGAALSDFILNKRVTVNPWNVAHFDLQVSTPATVVRQKQDKLEILTGYMPPGFSTFLALDRDAGAVRAISDGPGEQRSPVILCKPDGSAAMGAINTAWPGDAPDGCGYGRWRFPGCVKWNVVHRIAAPAPGAVHKEQVLVAWGQLGDVVEALSLYSGVVAGRVRRLYRATLDRAPDNGGMAYYIDRIGNGASLTELASGFIASPEFQSKYGNTSDEGLVQLLYRNVLGRSDASPAEVQGHVDEIRAAGRAQLVVNFSESREYQTRRLLLDAHAA